jgi:hypothetical protein
VDDLGIGQHAQLHRADAEVVEAGVDLGAQEIHRRHVHGADAARVLGGERGERAQAMHAVGGEGFQVGLDAGAAAGVGAGDGQRADGSGSHGAILPAAICRWRYTA